MVPQGSTHQQHEDVHEILYKVEHDVIDRTTVTMVTSVEEIKTVVFDCVSSSGKNAKRYAQI